MKRLYALILTIAMVFSISVAPAHAAVSTGAIIEGILAGLGVYSMTRTADTFLNWATASAEEKHNALRDANDSWYNLSRAQIVQYSVNVSADDLYSLALELNRLGFPCRIASGNFDGLGYGSVGTLWYIQGTGQMIDKYGNLLGTLSYDGESFATNINGKNFGDGMSRVGLSASPPRVFVARFDYSSAYLDSQLSVMNSILSALGTTNNLLASINNNIANLSGVSSGGGGSSIPTYGNQYYCIDDISKSVVYDANKAVFPSLSALAEFVSVLSTLNKPLTMMQSDPPYTFATTYAPYELSIKLYSDEVGYGVWVNNAYSGGWLHCAYASYPYDGNAFAMVHCPLDHAESDLLGQLLVKTINLAADVHDIATRVEEISDPLLTYIDTNFVDPLENVRPNVIISFQLFNNVFGDVSDDDHSLSDILEYFDDWGER